MKTLTKTEKAALSTILASGGLHSDNVHMGRLSAGQVRRLVVYKLVKLGLVECQGMGNVIDEFDYPDGTHCKRYVDYYYFVTAEGCKAFGPEIAKI